MRGKLIRDRIPEIAAANGDSIAVRTAGVGEMEWWLRRKLLEESSEAFQARGEDLLGELADVMEVVHALGAHYGHAPSSIEAARSAKFDERGGFSARLILMSKE